MTIPEYDEYEGRRHEKAKASAGCAPVSCSTAVNAWSESKPEQEGWWWMLFGENVDVIRVRRQRAYGNRLCAFVGMYREWTPLDEIKNALWCGPIPPPVEP